MRCVGSIIPKTMVRRSCRQERVVAGLVSRKQIWPDKSVPTVGFLAPKDFLGFVIQLMAM